VAASAAGAAAVVAICPAAGAALASGLAARRFTFGADVPALQALVTAHDELAAVRAPGPPILLQHAEGDEVVPVAHSRALHAAAPPGRCTLVVVPGGDHRSVQHDPAHQAQAVRFLARALGSAGVRGSSVGSAPRR
jgi:pimeloyl-ACP methyl ester carboxylesterase